MISLLPTLSLASALLMPAPSDPLTGTVSNALGGPLRGVHLVLVDAGREAESDGNGHFRFSEIAAGRHTLVVSRPGYASQSLAITTPSSPLAIRLLPSAFLIDPIAVTASRGPAETWAAAQPTAILGHDALARQQSVSIAAAIQTLPGVRSLSTGLQIGKPVIRGLSGQRILVLDQGHRMEDYSWSDEDGPSVDAAGARRVEVVRGPASLQYGSDAIGGVVNAIGDPLPDAIGVSPFHRSEAFFSVASNNVDAGLGMRYEGARGGLGWRLFGIGRFASALHTPDGELENTGFGAFNGDAAIGHRGARGDVSLRVAHYGGEFKLLEANGPPPGQQEGEEEGPERKAGDTRVQLDASRSAGAWRISAKSQMQVHSLIEVSDDATGAPGTESEAFNLTLNTLSLDLSARRMLGKLQLTLGGSGSHQTNDTKGPIPLVPDATSTGAAAFGLGSATFDRVTVSGGLRYDTHHIAAEVTPGSLTTATARDQHALSTSLGMSFRATDALAVTAHIGNAWRAPNLFDLFANGPLLAEARYEIGDAQLHPETSTTVEMGLHLERRTVRGSVNAYQTNVDDYIFITPTGTTQSSLPVYQHVQANARLLGFEAELDVNPVPSLTLHGQIDGVRSTNLEADEPLPLTPPLRTMFGAELHGVANGERRYAGADVELVSRQTRLNPLDFATDGYTLLGVHAGMTVHLGGHPMQLDVSGHNLANTRYRDFLSRYKQFALNPGRDIRARVAFSF